MYGESMKVFITNESIGWLLFFLIVSFVMLLSLIYWLVYAVTYLRRIMIELYLIRRSLEHDGIANRDKVQEQADTILRKYADKNASQTAYDVTRPPFIEQLKHYEPPEERAKKDEHD